MTIVSMFGVISQSLGKYEFKKCVPVFLSASFYQKSHGNNPLRFKNFQGNQRVL